MGRYSNLTQSMINYAKSYQFKLPPVPAVPALSYTYVRNLGTADAERMKWLKTLNRYQLRGVFKRDAPPALQAGDDALHALAYGPVEYWRLALWTLEYRSIPLHHGKALLEHCGKPLYGESRAQWLERTIGWLPRTDNGLANPQLLYRWRHGTWLSPDAWAMMLVRSNAANAAYQTRKKQLATKQKLDSGNSVG